MSLLDFPTDFEQFAPYIRVEVYGRDGGPSTPRFRLEFRTTDQLIEAQALAFKMPCVECQSLMHPFRMRRGDDGIYFASSCPLEVSVRCSRTKAATTEYRAVRAAVEVFQASRQLPIFEDDLQELLDSLDSE